MSCFCMILKRRDMLMLTVVPADYQSDTLNRDIVLFHILSLSNLYTSSKNRMSYASMPKKRYSLLYMKCFLA